ncbi:hypothetical protein TNCV_4185331 [Trichonephila clavipes]|nr:hypothetical protein TNCV_4185331 [Trichonephila clavipes]
MVSVQHLLDQCRLRTTIVFGNLGRWPDRVTYYEPDIFLIPFFLYPILGCTFLGRMEKQSLCVYESFGSDLGQRGRVEILSSGSFSLSPSLGGVSTSHDGCVQCGFDRLPSSRRRVRETVDVVGRLGNASRRSCALAHRGSSTLETGFGTTRAALA